MLAERFVHASGLRARVIEDGAGDAVFFIHGLGGWAENWRLTLPEVAGHGFRAIACDLPGFGRSERARGVRYFDPNDPFYARFANELLDKLGVSRAHLVGHSLGGAIAASIAIHTPERVSRLVLAAPGGFGEDVPAVLRMASLPFLGAVARFVPTAMVRDIVAANFADRSRVPPWMYDDAVRHARAGAAAEFVRVVAQLVSIRGPRLGLRRAWERRASRITSPTLIVWGVEDRVLPARHASAAQRLVPHARVRLIEGAGHLLMVECPHEFARILLAFLSAR